MADPTTYIVLRFNEATDEWIEHGDRIQATSTQDAIRKHASRQMAPMPITSSVFVAVPARSWKPVTVKAETVTTLKLENAGT